MSVPDLTQKIVGFRQWSIRDDKLFPIGVSNQAWEPGPQHAVCIKNHGGKYGHVMGCIPPVNPYCECGYYALHKLEEAHWHGDTMRGIVLGWGRVAVHNVGWRAQWVELAAVIYPQDASASEMKQTDLISKAYNVPVVKWDHAEEYAKEFGDYCPESLKPKGWTRDERNAHDKAEEEWRESQHRLSQELAKLPDELTEEGQLVMKVHKMVEEACEMLDPDVPEAYAALHNIYVPTVGELLQGLNEGIVVDYIPPPDPIVPATIDVGRTFEMSISTNATVLWLPLRSAGH